VGSVRFPIILGLNGGIGFQFEGGVITVMATNPNITLSFDRPMIYNGDYTDVASNYDISLPTLTSDARSLVVPLTITGGSISPISATALDGYTVVVVWPLPVLLLSTVEWVIKDANGAKLKVQSVRAGSPSTILTTDLQTQGASYTLTIPINAVYAPSVGSVNQTVSLAFVGAGVSGTILNGDGTPIWSNPPPYPRV
jgi:hypothetical protein